MNSWKQANVTRDRCTSTSIRFSWKSSFRSVISDSSIGQSRLHRQELSLSSAFKCPNEGSGSEEAFNCQGKTCSVISGFPSESFVTAGKVWTEKSSAAPSHGIQLPTGTCPDDFPVPFLLTANECQSSSIATGRWFQEDSLTTRDRCTSTSIRFSWKSSFRSEDL